MKNEKNSAAMELGRRGGMSRSPAKVEAARRNTLLRARRIHPDDLRFLAAAIVSASSQLDGSKGHEAVAELAWKRVAALEAKRPPRGNE